MLFPDLLWLPCQEPDLVQYHLWHLHLHRLLRHPQVPRGPPDLRQIDAARLQLDLAAVASDAARWKRERGQSTSQLPLALLRIKNYTFAVSIVASEMVEFVSVMPVSCKMSGQWRKPYIVELQTSVCFYVFKYYWEQSIPLLMSLTVWYFVLFIRRVLVQSLGLQQINALEPSQLNWKCWLRVLNGI